VIQLCLGLWAKLPWASIHPTTFLGVTLTYQIKPIDRIFIERRIRYPCVKEGVFALHARPAAATVLFTSIVATPRLTIWHTESRSY
jgi:hypothetical protein